MANEPLTPDCEKEIREHLNERCFGRHAQHTQILLAEIDRLRCERDDWRRNAEHSAAVGIEMRAEISRLHEELAIAEQENKEVRQGAERECDRLRAALQSVADFARAALEGKNND